jgi:predicted ATP-grasp superfamily ATP-dependent carboligase
VGDREAERIRVLGDTLARAFGLVGLFGVDLILRDGLPWPVEINPRYTASVEVLELALGRALLTEHRRACESTGPWAGVTPDSPAPSRHRVVGKVILFATERCRFPDLNLGPAATADAFQVPRFGDIPRAGTVIEEGWPVMTLFASGTDPATCQSRLESRRAFWEQILRQARTEGG